MRWGLSPDIYVGCGLGYEAGPSVTKVLLLGYPRYPKVTFAQVW